MIADIEYTENKNTTYEIVATYKDASGYVDRRVLYRFWEAGEGDWKIQCINNSDNKVDYALLLPKIVLDTILKVIVKGELKK